MKIFIAMECVGFMFFVFFMKSKYTIYNLFTLHFTSVIIPFLIGLSLNDNATKSIFLFTYYSFYKHQMQNTNQILAQLL
jgi:hypothetical protein